MEFQSNSKGIKLIIDSGSVPQRVINSDSKRYKQILFNLIGNAIKFTFSGSITIKLSYVAPDMLMTEVIDTGLGISGEDKLKLFKFFGKVQSSHSITQGGMGLGLSISKMIVEQLGGSILVCSNPGHGSNFSFTIKRNSEAELEELKISEDVTEREREI
jgi:signal transduction histidine kinase